MSEKVRLGQVWRHRTSGDRGIVIGYSYGTLEPGSVTLEPVWPAEREPGSVFVPKRSVFYTPAPRGLHVEYGPWYAESLELSFLDLMADWEPET